MGDGHARRPGSTSLIDAATGCGAHATTPTPASPRSCPHRDIHRVRQHACTSTYGDRGQPTVGLCERGRDDEASVDRRLQRERSGWTAWVRRSAAKIETAETRGKQVGTMRPKARARRSGWPHSREEVQTTEILKEQIATWASSGPTIGRARSATTLGHRWTVKTEVRRRTVHEMRRCRRSWLPL